MKELQIEKIMSILQKEVARFQEPSVTQVSRRRDPFQVLISCVLSLRTKDAVTIRASERLFSLASVPKEMLSLTEKEIQKAVYPVAFYRVKSMNIRKVCRLLIERHEGKVPDTMEELLKLPNVGRKTANIVLVFGHNKEGLPIDTHCHRIPNRLGWINTRTPEETETVLRKKLPKEHWDDFNNIFVIWGQNICAPVSPRCSECAIRKHCRRVGVDKSR